VAFSCFPRCAPDLPIAAVMMPRTQASRADHFAKFSGLVRARDTPLCLAEGLALIIDMASCRLSPRLTAPLFGHRFVTPRGACLDAPPPGLGRIDERIFDGANPTNGDDSRVGVPANDSVVVWCPGDPMNKAAGRNWHAG
jgi:hypothetical protein